MIVIPCPHCSHPVEVISGEINECEACGTRFILDESDRPNSAEECIYEVFKIQEELEHLDDSVLLDDCEEIMEMQKYLGDLSQARKEMKKNGALSPETSKFLEGIYILHFGISGVDE